MKEIKILHLFPKLLSLYGEYGNVAILKSTLPGSTVTECEDGNAQFENYDFIYIGSGTEDNLREAAGRLTDAGAEVAAAMEKGTLFLATGNAMALFGKSIARLDRQVAGVEAFSYTTHIREDKRYLGDVLTTDSNVCAARTLGFINTSCVYAGVKKPLLVLELGSKLGNDKQSAADGILEEHFIGTQLIGPFLVKNPHFLRFVCEKLTGEKLTIDPQSNQVKAYEVAVSQLLARLQK